MEYDGMCLFPFLFVYSVVACSRDTGQKTFSSFGIREPSVKQGQQLEKA